MRVTVDREEKYPHYFIQKQPHIEDRAMEINPHFWERYNKAKKEYDAVQIELEKLYEMWITT